MGSLEALLKDLHDFQAAAEATLLFFSQKLSSTQTPSFPLFPCPVNPNHKVPASALANHTASCQAAKGGYELKELNSPASCVFYADAPGVVQLHRLPVDQPRPPLPPQPNPIPHPSQHSPEPPFDLNPSPETPREGNSLRRALREWVTTGGASLAHPIAAQQELRSWRDVPSPLPQEAGRLMRAVPSDDLARVIQQGAAEGGVGLTLEEAGALGIMLMWQAQSASGDAQSASGDAQSPSRDGPPTEKEDRRQRVLTAVALLRPPAGAGPFLLHLWQHVLGGLLRTLPPLVPDPPVVKTSEMAAAVETLRDGVRRRQQREHAMRPVMSRAERLAKYDSGVQTAAVVRAQRPAYRPLPDRDWLFRPNDPNQPQGTGGRRNRVELLAELRDLKRRTTSYRAKKQRTAVQSARDLIELRMLQLEEAFGPARDSAAARASDGRDVAAARAFDGHDYAAARTSDSWDRATGDPDLGNSTWGADDRRKRRSDSGPSDGSRSKRGRWDAEDRGRDRREREGDERSRRGSSSRGERDAPSKGDKSARYERGRRAAHEERERDQDRRESRGSRRVLERHEEIEERELPQRGRDDRSWEGSNRGHVQPSERRGGRRTADGRGSERFGRDRLKLNDGRLDRMFDSGVRIAGKRRGVLEGGEMKIRRSGRES